MPLWYEQKPSSQKNLLGDLGSDLMGYMISSRVPNLPPQEERRCWVPRPPQVSLLSFLLCSGLSCRLTALSQTFKFLIRLEAWEEGEDGILSSPAA